MRSVLLFTVTPVSDPLFAIVLDNCIQDIKHRTQRKRPVRKSCCVASVMYRYRVIYRLRAVIVVQTLLPFGLDIRDCRRCCEAYSFYVARDCCAR